jgi:hypothetical protein
MLLSVGDGLIVLWYRSVPTTSPLLHPAPPNHLKLALPYLLQNQHVQRGLASVHSKRLTERAKPFRIRTYAKPGWRTQGSAHAFSHLRHSPPPWPGRRRFAVFAPCYVVSFYTNTNCPICKSFVLITMQQRGGRPFTVHYSKARPTRGQCRGANSRSPTFGHSVVPRFRATYCSKSASGPAGLRPCSVVYSSSGMALGSGSRNKVSRLKYSVLSIHSKECSCGLSSKT